MKYIGLDYGLSKTGIATGDAVLKIATIKGTFETKFLFKELNKIYKDKDIFVVGLPISMSGRYSKQTFETIDFCLKLKNNFNTDVVLMDERLTTRQSYSLTKNFLNSKKAKKAKDQNSALFILQMFLDNPNIGINLNIKNPYKIEELDSTNILINDVIIKNSNIYNNSDILAKDPYVFWWYYKRNKTSTTLFEDLKNEYDVIFTEFDIQIKYKKIIFLR
ncbi:Holliday junction resolvase RuvX [Marinitoga sp. 1154]|uniref:Holliday junction resolvase RuvX n=1 Tax=Marinitoga sp. 1154 TaxID=1643335 RepID=UPI001586904E|nr:Holliday junction resolvase RuvX [Marinitoga sp. 1154]